MPDWTEDKHPRAENGKFTDGGGAGAETGSESGGDASGNSGGAVDAYARASASLKDPAFVQQHLGRLSEAADTARNAFPREDHAKDEAHNAAQTAIHSEAMRIHEEADANANEKAAADAGHINELPKEVTSSLDEVQSIADEYKQTTDGLHASGQQAVDGLAELHAMSDEGSDIGLDESHHEDLASHYEGVSGQAVYVHEGENQDPLVAPEDNLEDHPGARSEPEPADFDEGPAGEAAYHAALASYPQDQKDYEQAAKDYEQAKDTHDREHAMRTAAFATKANEVQTALEAHQEKQLAALDKIKALDKQYDKAYAKADDAIGESESLVKESAFSSHATDEKTGEFKDPKVAADYERASNAADNRIERASHQLEHIGSTLDFDDKIGALKESISATKDAIKSLAKVTGRKPIKPAKPQKSTNGPDVGAGANVVGMARYKLKLSKLEFVSPVDMPAQETARVLLMKRAGPVRGFARVTKVDDSLGLVFCWAFTSTHKGAAYHDLQGDAIDEDFIKAAADFMTTGGGASDEMHDGKSTGRVVFAMPMTPEIAKAYGVTSDTTGLMVALRPTPAVLAKFKSGEYTGVSIAGLGTREVVKGKAPPFKRKPKKPMQTPADGSDAAASYKRVGKRAVLTSETDGHVHSIDLDDPADCWRDQLMTSYQTAEGATDGHCHAWVYDATTGAITIAMDSGHDHTVDVVVPADVLAEAADDTDDEDDCDGVPCAMEDEDSSGKVIVSVVSARVPGNSPPSNTTATVKSQEQAMATEQETKIAELTKANAGLRAVLGLNDAERAYHATLSGDAASAFIAKSATERAAILEPIEVAKRAAQEVVYTSASGEVYRKSHDPVLVAMAKRLDASEAASQQVTLEKRAGTELSHFAKVAPVRAAILKAVDGIADEAVRKEAHEALKGANAAMAELGKPRGFDGGVAPSGDAQSQLDALAKKYEADHKVSFSKAQVAILDTPEGAALYAQLPTGRA